MPPTPGDQISIRIGGDASAPVVAGHRNQVEVHQSPPAEQPGPPEQPGAAGEAATQPARPAGSTRMTNTANDQASVFSVMNGELHIHHAQPPTTPED
ncbi:hypothetical protein [Streptomyces palmae]|uniref:Uncharacterized protein n=1 Tax=Streptomyces palmae TaxID=1701085 RepID=A0A4Z0FKT2_9ACTN|nr:hypothetical protein [Streptomyces palmae]TGA83321.1 hypothetical protein E4099_32220 [Streptomyces palmae]